MKAITWHTVRELGLKLPNTTSGTAWGSPTLEVDGHRFAGIPIHKSAEPDSLAVHVEFADRDALIEEQPDVYYTAAHYENYPCVLVRLSRIRRDALEDLLRAGHRFVAGQHGRKHPRRRMRLPASVSGWRTRPGRRRGRE